MKRCPVCGTHFKPTSRGTIRKHDYWNGHKWAICRDGSGQPVIICDRI